MYLVNSAFSHRVQVWTLLSYLFAHFLSTTDVFCAQSTMVIKHKQNSFYFNYIIEFQNVIILEQILCMIQSIGTVDQSNHSFLYIIYCKFFYIIHCKFVTCMCFTIFQNNTSSEVKATNNTIQWLTLYITEAICQII